MTPSPATKPFTTDRLLVVGVDTALGANLALAWNGDAAVIGVESESCGPDAVAQIAAERPRFVVYCGPMAKGRWDLEAAGDDLAQLPAICATLAGAARKCGAHLTVVSTDAVFTGPAMFHPESRPAAAPTELARKIGALESSLAREALVVRTCVYGWAPLGATPTFAERIWSALRDGVACPADPDSYATPILATDLAEPLLRAMRRGVTGIRHAAGAERVSRHRFAVSVAQMASLPHDAAAIPQCSGEAGESSLDSRRFADLVGWTPPMAGDGLDRFVKQADEGWLVRLSRRTFAAAHRDAA